MINFICYVKDVIRYSLLKPSRHYLNTVYHTKDGVPIYVGMTVFDSNGVKYVVKDIYKTCIDYEFPDHVVHCIRLGRSCLDSHMFKPSQLYRSRYMI